MAVTASTYEAAVSGVLRRRYGSLRHAVKLIAQACSVSPRTAENWFSGACAPRGAELIRLMAEVQELEDEITRMVREARRK